jgi:hypothetical protein
MMKMMVMMMMEQWTAAANAAHFPCFGPFQVAQP